jgi:hypothetical protein
VLQACAQLLVREIGTESLASGLEVSVQVGATQGEVWREGGVGGSAPPPSTLPAACQALQLAPRPLFCCCCSSGCRAGCRACPGTARLALTLPCTCPATALHLPSPQGRLKSLYSTFRKMARKRVPLTEVFDARALRVVVDDDGGRWVGGRASSPPVVLPCRRSQHRFLLSPCEPCLQAARCSRAHLPSACQPACLPASRPPTCPPVPACRRQAEAIAACYKLLPAVHRLFRRVAGEEDDYIAQPMGGWGWVGWQGRAGREGAVVYGAGAACGSAFQGDCWSHPPPGLCAPSPTHPAWP